jgi:hypothetical protein
MKQRGWIKAAALGGREAAGSGMRGLLIPQQTRLAARCGLTGLPITGCLLTCLESLWRSGCFIDAAAAGKIVDHQTPH